VDGVKELVAAAELPAELAALVLVLAERGVPVVVAARDPERAATFRRALVRGVIAAQPTRDAVAGGVIVAAGLEEVLRVLGVGAIPQGADDHVHGSEVPDEARDLGVVLVLGDERLAVAHYVRPVERDGAGHLQRRPPAVLGAWNASAHEFDDFWWALTDELATRAGLGRSELEDLVDERRRQLVGADSAPGPPDARH
jgi:hypothetical protein